MENATLKMFPLNATTIFSRSWESLIRRSAGGSTGKLLAKVYVRSLCQLKLEDLPRKLRRVKLFVLIQIACGPADLGRLSWLSHIS